MKSRTHNHKSNKSQAFSPWAFFCPDFEVDQETKVRLVPLKTLFILLCVVGSFSLRAVAHTDLNSFLSQQFRQMSQLTPALQTEFAQRNIVPKLIVLMEQKNKDLIPFLRTLNNQNLPAHISDLISNYPPFIFAELEDLFKVQFLVSGSWSQGLTALEFASVIKHSKMNSDISLKDHYSYLDRVIVKREGTVFKKVIHSYTLPNPEGAMNIKFHAYFDDIIVTLPEHTTLDQAQEFLAGLTLRPEGFETDTKRLPEFFNDRIEAARAGLSSHDYYCKYILKEGLIPKTDNSLPPKE